MRCILLLPLFAALAATVSVPWLDLTPSRRMSYGKQGNILEVLQSLKASKMVKLVEKAGMTALLSDPTQTFTVFFPDDTAFRKIPPQVYDVVTSNKTLLRMVLNYHIVAGKVASTTLQNNQLLPTRSVIFNTTYSLRVNRYQNPGVPNEIIAVDGNAITVADQQAANGVVHILDDLIYPLPDLDGLQILLDNIYDFDTFSKLVVKAGFQQILQQPNANLTIFAPNEEAFMKIPADVLSNISRDPKYLQKVIARHVITSQSYFAIALVDGLSLDTVGGEKINIYRGPRGISVLGDNTMANVVRADFTILNGVVQEIDTLLYEMHSKSDKPAFFDVVF